MDKYEKALKQARNYYPDNLFLDTIFPELRESEDERTRKAIMSALERAREAHSLVGLELERAGVTYPQVFAWLEKQKDSKWSPSEDEMGVLYKLCYISNQVTDEDDAALTRLYQDLKREYFNGHSFENMFPSEKQDEPKPVRVIIEEIKE